MYNFQFLEILLSQHLNVFAGGVHGFKLSLAMELSLLLWGKKDFRDSRIKFEPNY